MPAPATNSELFDLIAKSGVMEDARLKSYLAALATTASGVPDSPVQLSELMVRDGILSGFQRENLLQGRWKRFFIGKYKVLERLGVGGMGQVFLCEHKLMKRKVAVKVLPAAKAKDTASLQRFYREARAVAAMDHPNLVRAYDIDEDGGLHFIVMEYVDGANLHDIVRLSGPLSPIRTAHYVYGSAVGLQHAHEMGLVHRDIKPANILIDRTGMVKILDMGLARFFNPDDDDHLTKKFDENVLGTADYLAPEQAIDSTDVDIRADIYGLGCTFYFMLTGQPPFPDGSVAVKLLAHQSREPKPITEYRNDVPAPLIAIASKMMAKERENRYQTPTELIAALAPWIRTPIAPPAEHELPHLSVAAGGSSRVNAKSSSPITLSNDLGRQPTQITPQATPIARPAIAKPAAPKTSTQPGADTPNIWEALTAMETNSTASQDTSRNRGTIAPADLAEPERGDDESISPYSGKRLTSKGVRKKRTGLVLALIVGGLLLLVGAITTAVLVFKPFGGAKVEPTIASKEHEPRTWYVATSGNGPDATTTRKNLADIGGDLKPGDRIVILDDTLESGPIRLKNIKLEAGNATKAVTWTYKPTAGNTSRAALEITDAENMTVSGLVIDVGGHLDVGVLVTGGGRGVVLERVTVKNSKKVGIRVVNANADANHPLKIDHCRVVGGADCDTAVHLAGSNRAGMGGIEITNGRFEGSGKGAVLRAEGAVSDCVFRNNRAYNFAVGVLVPLAGDEFSVTVERNTFHTLTSAGVQVDQAFAEGRSLTLSRNYFAKTAELGKVAGDANRVTATDNGRDPATKPGNLTATVVTGFTLPTPTPDQFLPRNNKLVVGTIKTPIGAE